MSTRPTVAGDTNFAEFVDHWLTHLRAESRLEGTTVNEYERVLGKVVIPELGDCGLRELTTNRMDCFLSLLGGLGVNRQRKAKVVTGAMLEIAVELGVIASNPVRGTASIVRPKTEARALTLDEIDTARAAVRTWMAKDRPGPNTVRQALTRASLQVVHGSVPQEGCGCIGPMPRAMTVAAVRRYQRRLMAEPPRSTGLRKSRKVRRPL